MWCVCLFALLARVSSQYYTGGYYSPQDEVLDNYPYPYESAYMSDWAAPSDWTNIIGGSMTKPRCIDIPSNMTLCQDLRYTQMRLPNLLEHDTVKEVVLQSAVWESLVAIRCHPSTQLFLCSLFAPVCLEQHQPIYPCRDLCEAVKHGCEARMIRRGFSWPEMLHCNKFPPPNGMCIGLEAAMEAGQGLCEPCNQPNTFEAIMDNFCSASIVMRLTLRKEKKTREGVRLVSSKKRKLLKEVPTDIKRKEIKELDIHVKSATKCQCPLKEKQRYLVMGDIKSGQFYARAIHVYDRTNKSLKKALRTMRKEPAFCERKGMEIFNSDDNDVPRLKRHNGKSAAEGSGRPTPSNENNL